MTDAVPQPADVGFGEYPIDAHLWTIVERAAQLPGPLHRAVIATVAAVARLTPAASAVTHRALQFHEDCDTRTYTQLVTTPKPESEPA